jgi:hypothetical protein
VFPLPVWPRACPPCLRRGLARLQRRWRRRGGGCGWSWRGCWPASGRSGRPSGWRAPPPPCASPSTPRTIGLGRRRSARHLWGRGWTLPVSLDLGCLPCWCHIRIPGPKLCISPLSRLLSPPLLSCLAGPGVPHLQVLPAPVGCGVHLPAGQDGLPQGEPATGATRATATANSSAQCC